jgi:hypothetical protein
MGVIAFRLGLFAEGGRPWGRKAMKTWALAIKQVANWSGMVLAGGLAPVQRREHSSATEKNRF